MLRKGRFYFEMQSLTYFHTITFALIVLALHLHPSSTSKLPKVLVIGGSGRVGGSAVRALVSPPYGSSIDSVTVAGRDRSKWISYKNDFSWSRLEPIFVSLDFRDKALLDKVVSEYDLVINTAGPFQGLSTSPVLESCLEQGKLYVDVCDDINLSRICRNSRNQEIARKTGCKAIISAGIWPGCSSLLAQKLIKEMNIRNESVDKVSFSFFTAGSGGAGATILSATFLLLGEDVLVYDNKQPVYYSAASDVNTVDFGPKIANREVARLNLIECESCHVAGVGSVETFFGTAPFLWNRLFQLMANLIPKSILKNRDLMQKFAILSLPMVKLVDSLVGSANAIRIDASSSKSTQTALLSHQDMEAAVGEALALFACTLWDNRDNVIPGVYFPEEIEIPTYSESILNGIAKSAIAYTTNY